jgi:hypothetical protein
MLGQTEEDIGVITLARQVEMQLTCPEVEICEQD